MNRLQRILGSALVAGGVAAMASMALAADCAPSKWGADDEIGAANYVDSNQVLMAAKLIKKGETHPLGIVVDPMRCGRI